MCRLMSALHVFLLRCRGARETIPPITCFGVYEAKVVQALRVIGPQLERLVVKLVTHMGE